MTTVELIKWMNNNYDIEGPWPETLNVSASTYGYACQAVINKTKENIELYFQWTGLEDKVCLAIGNNNGLMFKNVELIITEDGM